MNFIVPQIEAEELAKLLHESCRSVTANYIEWDKMDDKMQKVFMTQAKSALAHYCIAPPDEIDYLVESLKCAQDKLRKCHSAMAAVIGVETNEEMSKMKGVLQMVMMLPGMTGSAAAKEVAPLVAMIDTLFDTGYHNDGTCTGDAAKCCGNCGDRQEISDALLEKHNAECANDPCLNGTYHEDLVTEAAAPTDTQWGPI